jgi:hypothetical protein
MTRHRKTDAHIATVRVSVPIAAMDPVSVQVAAEAIAGIVDRLPPGSTVEIINSRFGRVDMKVVAEVEVQADMIESMQQIKTSIATAAQDIKLDVRSQAEANVIAVRGSNDVPAFEVCVQAEMRALTDEPETPESLRRVPRMTG